jgi:hypothetical protein
MRQTIRFEATGFALSPVAVEVPEGAEPPEEGALPVALLAFEGGPSLVLTLPIGTSDAESMMEAFTQAEAHHETMPEAQGWEPATGSLPNGVFWALTPTVVGVSVTPPQATPDGVIPHWTLAFDDEDGSQVQVAVGDALCVQVVRALAQVAHGDLPTGEDEGGEEHTAP